MGARLGTARAPGLGDQIVGIERMVALGGPALREAIRDAQVPENEPIRVFLAFPERARPVPKDDVPKTLPSAFVPLLERAAGHRIDGAGSEVLRLGHAGFAVAVERAIAALPKGGAIAVGGIDTYHHPETFAHLDPRERRLLSERTKNGFIPSEGAAFIILSARSARKPLARIALAMAGAEALAEGEPRIGTVLTELVQKAAGAARLKPALWVLTDVSNEQHRAKEWSFVTIRSRDALDPERTREDHLGQLAGDAGAATGALAAVHAAVAFRTGFAPAPHALVALASDGDERGVVVLESAS